MEKNILRTYGNIIYQWGIFHSALLETNRWKSGEQPINLEIFHSYVSFTNGISLLNKPTGFHVNPAEIWG